MTDHASEFSRIDTGQRAKAALEEYLDPAFEVVIADYMNRLTEIASEAPWEASKIVKLAMAAKVARMVRQQIVQLVADGIAAEADVKRARQIEGMTTERRKILGVM